MQLQQVDYRFTLLTPCFAGTALGKNDNHAEMRIPPIRGHVRFWHRQLFGVASTNQVWGSTSGDQGRGSRVALRLLEGKINGSDEEHVLPHNLSKSGKRHSLPERRSFSIQLQRLVGCEAEDWGRAQSAVKLWLIVGSLGYRSNRAAGSVWPEEDWAPRSIQDLATEMRPLLRREPQPWGAAVIGETALAEPDLLRKAASNTPNNEVFGSAKPRKPSPTRFKVIQLTAGYCLLALAPSKQTLEQAQRLIEGKVDRQGWNNLGPWKSLIV